MAIVHGKRCVAIGPVLKSHGIHIELVSSWGSPEGRFVGRTCFGCHKLISEQYYRGQAPTQVPVPSALLKLCCVVKHGNQKDIGSIGGAPLASFGCK